MNVKTQNAMKVPLLDLAGQYEPLRDEIRAAVQTVVDSQRYVNGPCGRELEQKIAEYSGCAAATSVSSGTDALLVSLMALDIGAGDEVITTPFTFFGTAGVIWRSGARPVFVDIDARTFNIDPERIEAAITERTKAIMPVHLFGQMADMSPIMQIARRHNLHVIEDAAQAIGAAQNGAKAGSIGTVGCISFYPTKNLGGLGDGGMVVTQDVELNKKITMLRQHGETSRYHHKWVGGNFRMDEIQAAGLLVKFKHLESWSQRRREIAARYDELLNGCDDIRTPVIAPNNVSVINQYVIVADRRDELKQHLEQHGIGCGIYYPLGLHQQECFSPLGYQRGDFPVTEHAADHVLALPIFAELREQQIQYVAQHVRSFYG